MANTGAPRNVANPIIAMKALMRSAVSGDEGMRILMTLAIQAINEANAAAESATLDAGHQRRRARRAANALAQVEARNLELGNIVKLEREKRLRAESATQSATPESVQGSDPGELAELAELRSELIQVSADRDLFAELVDVVEGERDTVVRKLARALSRLGELEPHSVIANSEEPPPPVTFAAVIAQATAAYPLLALTLDRESAARLDQHPQAPAWRRRTASALDTLGAYAAAKAAARHTDAARGTYLADIVTFARHGGAGVYLSAASIALRESQRVIECPRFAAARVFPTPAEVNPAGEAAMYAHIRIGGVQPPAPRLHFLDDTDRSGYVVVGYLGPHLPSQRTN